MNNMRKLMEAVNGSVRNNDIVAQAGEFKVVREGEMIHIIDGAQTIRLSMFGHEWDDLIASYDNGDYIDEAEDMLAVDPAVQAEIEQDKNATTWSVWWGDNTGEEGWLARDLTQEKAITVLKTTVKDMMATCSEQAYVVHTPGKMQWTLKDPLNQLFVHYELQAFEGQMRDWDY